MNATLSADNRTCVAVFSNGHRGTGNVSLACDSIRWSDGSAWRSLAGVPPLRVHVAPHTHNDVGWGQTYLQYYFGTGPYGPEFRNATKIFSQVIAGLLADPKRRFSYVEQAFFQLFYESAPPDMRAAVRGLVASRQLVFCKSIETNSSAARAPTSSPSPQRAACRDHRDPHVLTIVNGGFSMHDEAAPTFVDMMDNLAVGHRSIAAEFGVSALPTLAWSIDPFGRASFTPNPERTQDLHAS